MNAYDSQTKIELEPLDQPSIHKLVLIASIEEVCTDEIIISQPLVGALNHPIAKGEMFRLLVTAKSIGQLSGKTESLGRIEIPANDLRMVYELMVDLTRAAIELAKLWRTDRMLRRLESLLIVADRAKTLTISGMGDVIEPSDGICAIGSGGSYALAAARVLQAHTDKDPAEVCKLALQTAGDICIYTNTSITVLYLNE